MSTDQTTALYFLALLSLAFLLAPLVCGRWWR